MNKKLALKVNHISSASKQRNTSILHWAKHYWEHHVLGSPEGTIRAKKQDLELFLTYFMEVVGSDCVEYWTPSISKSFRSWLGKANKSKPLRKHRKAYAPTSINRTLATLRHFARSIEERCHFHAGYPMLGVKDHDLKEPEWSGLSDLELNRLRAALDELTKISSRSQQMPLRNRVIFYLGINTGLRAGEICHLDYSQLDGKYLRHVQGKGSTYDDVYLGADVRKEIEGYIKYERGRDDGALIVTNRGNRISRQQIDRLMKKIAAHANSKIVDPEESIQLYSHKLRHTSTKRVYLTKGAVEAKKFSRHRSFKQLERYATATKEEHENMVDTLWD